MLKISVASVLTLVVGMAIGLFAWGTIKMASPPPAATAQSAHQNNYAKLHYLTDSTLRLFQISNDEELARENVDKWVELRGTIEKSEDTEVGLEVIEGHLKSIFETIYHGDDRGERRDEMLDSTHRWYVTQDSVETIRTAQGQIIKLLKLRWKDAQGSSLYASTFAKLREEGQRIVSMSEVGKNNLPQSMTAEEAKQLHRSLVSHYSVVPLDERDTLTLRTKGDGYSIPSGIDSPLGHYPAKWILTTAKSVINARTHVPVLHETLNEKTDSLKFSEEYRTNLNDLRDAVR